MATTSTKQTVHYGVVTNQQVFSDVDGTHKRSGRLHLVWMTPAAANATCVIYDGQVAGDAVSANQIANVSAQTPWSNGTDFDVEFKRGLIVTTTGTGCDVQITFE